MIAVNAKNCLQRVLRARYLHQQGGNMFYSGKLPGIFQAMYLFDPLRIVDVIIGKL
jgi:hypothetical protein